MNALHACTLAALLCTATLARAADDADLAALSLADTEVAPTTPARDWQLFIEGAAGFGADRAGGHDQSQRLSGSFSLDTRLAPDWRLVLSDRLDQRWVGSFDHGDAVNTLRDAYLSWQAGDNTALDAGRINTRYGVAMGYNPTDWFRANAIRSRVSEDPGSLRENRQGSVMLRGQQLWDGGAVTALYSPGLSDIQRDGSFDLDLGATNYRDRGLVAVTTRINDSLGPEWLLYHAAGGEPQLGANLTVLANAATVAYVEWSGGRASSLAALAAGQDDSTFRNRLALGATYTTASKLSLTLEYDYNGAALDDAGWQALQAGSPLAYWRYRALVRDLQELPTRHAWFARAAWQDAIISHLDLTGMLRLNGDDHSTLTWLEARYHWDKTDLALQWQLNRGDAGSEYGALAQRQFWQLLVTQYF